MKTRINSQTTVATPDNAIAINNLTKSFGDTPVLNNLNFTLQKGQIMGLLGRNGAGKSTLMRLALGLQLPNSGTIQTLNEQPTQLSTSAKNRIGYVAQNFSGFDGMTVNTAFKFISHHYTTWSQPFFKQLCTAFDVPLASKINQISGGQRQAVALVMAMAHKPELLILDEPASDLDPINRRAFLQQVVELAIDCESTVLFSTHITSDIERIASHVCFLANGHIALQGELDELKNSIVKFSSNQALPPSAIELARHQEYIVAQLKTGTIEPNSDAFQHLNLDDLFIALTSKAVL